MSLELRSATPLAVQALAHQCGLKRTIALRCTHQIPHQPDRSKSNRSNTQRSHNLASYVKSKELLSSELFNKMDA